MQLEIHTRKSLLHYFLVLLLPTVVLFHLYVAPYTKVEESFNIQAIHDILIHGVPLQDVTARLSSDYDHMSFPGVVPRTFVGALAIAGAAKPFASLARDGEQLQLLVRGIIGLINALAMISFEEAICKAFGNVAGMWYIAFQISQFHVMYYASRTLPNMYAFALTTLSLRYFVLCNFGSRAKRARQQSLALSLLTFAGVVFRSEIALLLAFQSVALLVLRRVSPTRVIIPAGIASAAIAFVTTVTIDSFFWQRPLWPEWTAFRFNTLEGHSAEWGTSPWHFYFAKSLPKLLMNPLTYLLCIPLALADRGIRSPSVGLLAPQLAFIATYSLLPHKEWRFIIYAVPALTGVAAAGASWIWTRRAKSWGHALLALALVGSTGVSFAASMGLLGISSLNYPGAMALRRLHGIADGERPLVRVHLDNLSCQTGVTRFLQKPRPDVVPEGNGTVWYYDKTEDVGLLADSAFWQKFDYVLAEDETAAIGQWEVVDVVEGYAGVGLVRVVPEEQRERMLKDEMKTRSAWLAQAVDLWEKVQWALRRYVTGGRWIEVKMEPKIKILRKQD